MEDKTILSMFAIGGIVALDAIAIATGMNGILFSTSLCAIAGIAGYEVKAIKDFITKK